MKGGYNRKSTQAKILAGTFNSTKAPTEQAIRDVAKDLQPPEYLQGIALDCWNYYAPILQEMKVITDADLATLEKFCAAYSIYREAYEQMQRNGSVIEAANGNIRRNPAYDVWKGAMAETRSHAALLGLDPFDRGRLDVSTAISTENPFTNL